MSATIDTETLSTDAHQALHEHDTRMIGTDAYLGLAYFWNYAYRYPMRDVSYACRRRIHAAMLAAGLPLDEASRKHADIIEQGLFGADRKHLADCYGPLPPLRTHQTPDGMTYATSRAANEGDTEQ